MSSVNSPSGKTVDLGVLPGRIGDAAFEMLEEHELVERVVPLHQEDPARQGSAEVLEHNNKQLLNICITHPKYTWYFLSVCPPLLNWFKNRNELKI
jgi:hypothetical protein